MSVDPSLQRRDNWSRETVRSLRRRLRNVQRELLIQAAYREAAVCKARERSIRQGARDADIRIRRIEDTLSLMAQQQAWYRERFKHIAMLLRSHDWRQRAACNPGYHLDVLMWLAEDAMRQPMFPDAAPATEDASCDIN